MLCDVVDDSLGGLRILHFWIAVRPVAPWMQCVPRRAKIGARFRGIAVLAEPITDAYLVIPDRLEQTNQIGFGRALPPALHHKSAILKIFHL